MAGSRILTTTDDLRSMRVLFLTETVPFPLDSGGRIKTWNVIRMLGAEHEVHCHSFVRRPQDMRLADEVRRICTASTPYLMERSPAREAVYGIRSLLKNVPFVVERHFDGSILERLRREVLHMSFDCVYCDHLSMIEYGRRLGLPIVYDAHNVEFEILRRHAATAGASPVRIPLEIEWRRVRAYERLALAMSSLVFAVSQQDAAALAGLTNDPPQIHVVPISIDVKSMTGPGPLETRPHLLFVGGLHWPPNADAVRYFLNEVWPAVRQAAPSAQLTVVGRSENGPSSNRDPNVRYTGYVDDVEPFFRSSRVMIVPIRAGSGMRVKILEAFARGIPVVSTAIGCEGVEAISGVHLAVGDTPGEFGSAVLAILADDQLADRLRTNARGLVESRYDTALVERSVLGAMRNFQPLKT